MAIRERTKTEIATAVRAYLRAQYPTAGLGDTRFLGKLAAVIATGLLLIEQSIERADRDGTPTARSSTTALDQWAVLFGLPRTGGGYGRNPAVAAAGGAGQVLGVAGTIFPINAVLVADDGVTQVKLTAGVTLAGVAPAPSSADGTFAAVEAGAGGNLPAGTELRWQSTPPGGEDTVTLTTALSGGIDQESDRDLLERLHTHLRTPPQGAAIQDYREWAGAVVGVFQVFVYPLRAASGTVDLVVLGPGSGASRSGAALVADVIDFLEPRLPADMEMVNVYGGTFPAGLEVRTRVVPAAGNEWDWDDAGAPLVVDAYSAGTGAGGADQLTFTVTAPAALTDAITAGRRPRLQVLVTGGPAVPVQVRCTAFTTIAGPKTKVDLENPLPTGFKPPEPQAADLVYAGGPVATAIAQAQLDHIDSLGPSRASGYADELHPWDDTLRIARLIELAMGALDAAGARLVDNVVFTGTTPEVTIDGLVADSQAADNGFQISPEILSAAHVVVTA